LTIPTKSRLKAHRNWLTMHEPHWPNVKYGPIDYQAISYYAAPKKLPKLDSLDQVDPKLVAIVPVAVDDPAVIDDLNTPEDYERLVREINRDAY